MTKLKDKGNSYSKDRNYSAAASYSAAQGIGPQWHFAQYKLG